MSSIIGSPSRGPPAVPMPLDGSSWAFAATSSTSISPSQNTARLNKDTDTTLTTVSSTDPGRRAMTVPSNVPSSMEKTRLVPTSSSSAGTRARISPATGAWLTNNVPRSPVSTWPR